MELECYPTAERPPEIVPGRPQRAWMDRFAERHPYRCLPLTMANTTGWEILCPMAFTAEWNGGVMQDDIKMVPDRPHPDFHNFVKSHFSHGVMTFHPGYLFRTPPGWSMIAQGPPNHVKDGIQPLAGLVEKYSSLGHLGQLSPRQLEVLRARARGEPFKSIARRLGIDQRTVEDHMYAVTRRFADYLRTHSLADLEHELGIAPRDLLDPDG